MIYQVNEKKNGVKCIVFGDDFDLKDILNNKFMLKELLIMTKWNWNIK